jgi:Histidine kinase-, DNA gyrase B-, and HSP90-like ATPase
MTSLSMNLVKRVERLPKPYNASEAMQPLFEAISNSIHSTQEKFGSNVGSQGRIYVEVMTDRAKSEVGASVADNGVGLDKKNYEAFLTTDTDNKIAIGGKGVGRLLWLDCFERVHIESIYKNGKTLHKRSFDFRLSAKEQVINYKETNKGLNSAHTGMNTTFAGLRDNGYLDRFPGRPSYIFQHFMSHFLPTFISGSPRNAPFGMLVV